MLAGSNCGVRDIVDFIVNSVCESVSYTLLVSTAPMSDISCNDIHIY